MKNDDKSTISKLLLGDRTRAKGAGLSFSLAAILPTFLMAAILIVLAVAGALPKGLTEEGVPLPDWYRYISYLVSPIALATVAFLSLRYTGEKPKAALFRQKCDWKYILVALLLQIGLLSLSELNSFFLIWLEKLGLGSSEVVLPSLDGFGFVGVLLVVGVLPAVFEEILFRGILLDGLRSFGETAAVLICGGLFSLYHQNPAQTLYQFCCGAAFALVAIRAGSVLPTVVSHFLNNAFIIVLYKLGIETFSPVVQWTVIAGSVVCLLGSLAYLFFFDKRKETVTETTEKPQGTKSQFFIFASVGILVCALTWISVLLGA